MQNLDTYQERGLLILVSFWHAILLYYLLNSTFHLLHVAPVLCVLVFIIFWDFISKLFLNIYLSLLLFLLLSLICVFQLLWGRRLLMRLIEKLAAANRFLVCQFISVYILQMVWRTVCFLFVLFNCLQWCISKSIWGFWFFPDKGCWWCICFE